MDSPIGTTSDRSAPSQERAVCGLAQPAKDRREPAGAAPDSVMPRTGTEPVSACASFAADPGRSTDGKRRWGRRPPPPYPPPTGCRRVILPFYGFLLDADDDHRRRVDRFFQAPMLILSLLVLPILVAQYYFITHLSHPWLSIGLEAAFFVIAFAFLVEFAIKVTIAQSRARYCLVNWLDLVIILLPFLRPLRIARAAQVIRLSRAYTLRGVGMKFCRTAFAFLLGTRFARRLQARFARPAPVDKSPPDYTQWSRAALIAEITRLQERVRELEQQSPGELARQARDSSGPHRLTD